jgi:hypothetical protein
MKTGFILSLFLSGIGIAQPVSTSTPTGSMISPRFAHSATLLPNGKVLIAGGFATCSMFGYPNEVCVGINRAELYDPVTGSFAATGSMAMTNPRGGILLPDGRVLFAGDDVSDSLVHVELYDPSTGTFTTVGSLRTLGVVSSVTLLNDGRVLFAGRVSSSAPVPIGAELYDPVSGAFAPVANWPNRIGYTEAFATLSDGRVLFDTGALYNPASGIFSITDGQGLLKDLDLIPPANLLLDGRVLFAGGGQRWRPSDRRSIV